MLITFYIAAAVAVISTILVITRLNVVHALLYLIVSLLSVAVVFFTLGAPFIAALEVIIYAGAIVVLFVFVVMMLNLGKTAVAQERVWLAPRTWIGPGILTAVLFVPFLGILFQNSAAPLSPAVVPAQAVGQSLYGAYLLGVELSAILLLAGIVGAYHLGRRKKYSRHRYLEETQL